MADHQLPDLTVVQLSDSHLYADAARRLDGTVDTTAQFVAALEAVAAFRPAPAAIIVSGDLAEDGAEGTYQRARALLEETVERLGGDCPVLVTLGNHDDRRAFRAGYLGESDPSDAPWTSVVEVDGLRLVGLDSTVDRRPHGHLDEAQLAWLADVLATPAPRGTVVVVHHPPIPSPVGLMNTMGLRNAAALGEVLRGSDVRLVLSGHVHHASAGTIAGVPVWTSPALAYYLDPFVPTDAGYLRGLGLVGLTRVDVRGRDVVATAVPVDARLPETVRFRMS